MLAVVRLGCGWTRCERSMEAEARGAAHGQLRTGVPKPRMPESDRGKGGHRPKPRMDPSLHKNQWVKTYVKAEPAFVPR